MLVIVLAVGGFMFKDKLFEVYSKVTEKEENKSIVSDVNQTVMTVETVAAGTTTTDEKKIKNETHSDEKRPVTHREVKKKEVVKNSEKSDSPKANNEKAENDAPAINSLVK